MARVVRGVVGTLLLLEALALMMLGAFAGIVGGLAGALAFVAGGGSAPNAKVAQAFAVMAATLVSPFLVAVALGLGGVFLLLRKRRWFIITAAVSAIAAQIAFHPIFAEPLHAVDLVPATVQLAAIAAGFAFVPAGRHAPMGG